MDITDQEIREKLRRTLRLFKKIGAGGELNQEENIIDSIYFCEECGTRLNLREILSKKE